MTSSGAGQDHALKILGQLRKAFVGELGERCEELESLVLALRDADDPEAGFDELYRRVHSLKGSAGTHGLGVISAICHQLEDQLQGLSGDWARIDAGFVQICLDHVDLIRGVAEEAGAGGSDFRAQEKALERLRQDRLAERRPGLIVESSAVLAMMCRDALAGLPVDLTVVDDGLRALERLLHERFDFVITARNAKTLNGVALTCALRASNSPSRTAKVVMLTSGKAADFSPGTAPDYVVQRDTGLAASLVRVVDGILAGRAG